MNIFQEKKVRKLYHRQSECVHSFDFRRTPEELRQTLTKEEAKDLMAIPLIRVGESRTILVNEAVGGWEFFAKTLAALDSLMDVALHDLYALYAKRRAHVTASSIKTFDDGETYRRMLLCLIPEILWCHGDDNIKSRIF